MKTIVMMTKMRRMNGIMIKVYYTKSRKGYWIASTDELKLNGARIYECEVETIHNNKLYIKDLIVIMVVFLILNIILNYIIL